MTNKWYKCELL